jgi:hypothetical protein
MRPADIKRDLERLTVDASQARAQIVELRAKLLDARSIINQLRNDLRAAPATNAERTPPVEHAQDRA